MAQNNSVFQLLKNTSDKQQKFPYGSVFQMLPHSCSPMQLQKRRDCQVSMQILPNGRTISLSSHGKKVGAVTLLSSQSRTSELVNLNVDQEHRGQEFGKQLVFEAIHTAKSMGKNKIQLQSEDNGSRKLIRWYEGLGFKQIGRGRDGYPLMEKYI
ncbi:GNAT family N-acetyltransferase [Candidatus Uabimicrobium amorphum]|uniref:Putative N-acetyltransferase YvbK n=1 Tax=Uabimicrobium amorphum TaxID=2596890 RepID=A0A5S9F5B2_UABAM|nr:GNAT family N-acetyltransferase [Candidatus Uabimicrobium amorphum]BBM86677.1 putative N-acetyltransferase YvbK [Candidatus Uabimicrobium amorphum]